MRRHGFTLIEMACVLGVITILTSIAIPTFTIYMQRAKETEALINVEAIAYLEQVRILEIGEAIACEPRPEAVPGGDRASFQSTNAWADLGFMPSPAAVRFQYEVQKRGPKQFTVIARGDLDRDGKTTEIVLDSDRFEIERRIKQP